MSTKEILSRLSRTPADAARAKPAASGAPAPSAASDKETRVSGGIIRRRRAADPPPAPEPAPLPQRAAPSMTRPLSALGARPVEPVKAPVETPELQAREPVEVEPVSPVVEPAVVGTSTETAPSVDLAPEPPAVEPSPVQAEPLVEPVLVVQEPAPTPEPVPEPAPEPAVGEQPAPAAFSELAQALLQAQSATVVPPVESATARQKTPEPSAEKAHGKTEKTVVPVPPVETAPKVAPVTEPVVVVAPRAHEAARPGRPGEPARGPDLRSGRPVSPQEAGRSLPTLGQRQHELPLDKNGVPRVTGLGKAVVRPPPGYDPNDPLGNRRRAREAAEASTRPAKPTPAPVEVRWVDPAEAPAAGREDGRDTRPKGRPRRKERKVGRVEMLVEDVPLDVRRKRRARGGPRKVSPQPKAQKRRVQIDKTITVGALAQELSIKSAELIARLMKMGKTASINEILDFETAVLVATEYQYEVVDVGFKEEEHLIQLTEEEEGKVSRPPVVTIMGHVDHGKTSLLDKIRKANVAGGEAGGITQHVGAYQVKHKNQLVTFIDTPGHAAFTAMRARGAQVTDIVVLVVAADDGVMPQTIESINHTRAADVPMVVAINKCDKAGVKPDLIRRRLTDQGLIAEEYGGDVQMVNVSAMTGKGIPDLLDAILLLSEMEELVANPERHAEGVVLEARMERGRGPVATVIIQEGTLKQGDHFVAGVVCGRVRAVSDFAGKPIKSAGPSTPVEIMGLEDVPAAGDVFVVVESEKAARALAEHRTEERRQAGIKGRQKFTLEDLYAQNKKGEEKKDMNIVLKCDVQGSSEALQAALQELRVEGADLKVLHCGVGAVSESDVILASAYGAVIIGFNVRPDAPARKAAEQSGVEIRGYTIIYELLDEVRKAMVGLLAPITEEKHEGSAEVRDIFSIPKVGVIAGCFVLDGKVARNHDVRLVRDGVVVWEGRMGSLRRFKDDVREVQKGLECGIGLDGYNDLKSGDIIECSSRIRIAATG